MMSKEIIAACSEIYTNHINTRRGQFFDVTAGGI
jgi:hypothetical protein